MVTFNLTVPWYAKRRAYSEYSGKGAKTKNSIAFLPANHAARIQLRVLPSLWAFWAAVVASTLDLGGMRLRNTQAAAHG